MDISKLFVVIFMVGARFCNSQVPEHILRTYQSTTQYLKGRTNDQVRCDKGEDGALRFHILNRGLTAMIGQSAFRAAEFSRFYLRSNEDDEVSLEYYRGSTAFNREGSFTTRPDFFFRGTTSYESIVDKRHYLMCKNGKLVIRRVYNSGDRMSASFIAEKVASRDDHKWTTCTKSCGGGWQESKERSCFGSVCASPSRRRCNTHECVDHCHPNPCQNGRCIERSNGFTCDCDRGYTGRLCDEEINPCKPNPCKNNGYCSRRGSGYECLCDAGFSGDHCEIVENPCKPNPCQNGGTCKRHGGEYSCQCTTGFSGRKCTTSVDPCDPNPCQNDGFCDKDGSRYRCYCQAGFSGDDCEIAFRPCKPNPCENGGTCSSEGAEFKCHCRSGFSGFTCQKSTTNACSPRPCMNGGTCRPSGSGYTCDCKSGFTGKNCETASDPCDSRPCLNGGICRKSGKGYICTCKSGFTGKNCQTATGGGKCRSTSCKNGGTCVETATGYVCNCKIGFHGATCNKKMTMRAWSECSRTCGGGTRYRATSCAKGTVKDCPREYQDCSTENCPAVNCGDNCRRHGTQAACCKRTSGSCDRVRPRIFGGVASDHGQWPWMAAAIYTRSDPPAFFCGGMIIARNWILTAAHCAVSYDAEDIEVLVGANTRNSPENGSKKVKVSRTIAHEDFQNPRNDLGLYKLKTSLTYTWSIQPISLPNGERAPVEMECFASGWGIAVKENLPSKKIENKMRHVALRRLPLDACVQGFKSTQFRDDVTDKIFCAGLLKGGKDTCTGDSGGPLVCQRKDSCEWFVGGVTSFGPDECGLGTIPGAYVDVVQYESWIKKKMSSN